ncbi:MAG: right-handed parallel beta-helix repeat-containing protein [bacterium]|nr:right-handed parallel beta-helix repeat-containing protein [bacterium]
MRRLTLLLVLLPFAAPVAAQPDCPATASLAIYADNASADGTVTMTVTGELLAPAATCAGTGATSYERTVHCSGAGLAGCGVVSGLRPGAWVHRVTVVVTGSAAQRQARREVVIADAGPRPANALVWTVYPRTFVVTAATQDALREQLDAASAFTATHPGSALVTFAPEIFAGAHDPRTIDLVRTRCDPEPARAAGLCVAGNRVVVDALDRSGEPGAVVLSVGARLLTVLRLYGSDTVWRGLVFVGSTVGGSVQADTIAIVGAAAQNARLERSLVRGPSAGDAVSVEDGARGNVIDSILVGAQKKGLIVGAGSQAVLRTSCVHDNRGGGVQALDGGQVLAAGNVIVRNVPGAAGHGLAASATGPDPSVLITNGNIVRLAGGRGISVTDHAIASLDNDYVADNQFAGIKIETSAAAGPGVAPIAALHGTALVCNRNAGVSGSCQPLADGDGVACGGAADCCGIPGTCCVDDAGCTAPLACQLLSFPRGYGASQAAEAGRTPPQVSYGDALRAGRNAFTLNRGAPAGANLFVNVPGAAVAARGNQWERCGPGATCDVAAVLAADGDVRTAAGATVDVGTPPGPRAGTPTLALVQPGRPRAGDLVRVFGDGFDAIDGTACGEAGTPNDPCAAGDAAVERRNEQTQANRIRLLRGDGQVLATVYPLAVTPTMLVFRMPFDCFAALTLQVSKRAPDGGRLSATLPLCDPSGCLGQPAGVACDDGSACTTDDRCLGDEAGTCQGTSVVCSGACLTGSCDPAQGCVPKPASAACDDGNACTTNDRCNGVGNVCVAGPPRSCDAPCFTGACHPQLGCEARPAGAICRQAAGACDVAETCDGVTGACPANAFQPSTLVCRPAAGPCDVAETCTGSAAACPVNAFLPSTVVCREAAGVCDLAETCTGTSAACPANLRGTGVCRPAAGVCDVAEHCTGTRDDCPPDVLVAAGVTCRAAADACDVAETCTGAAAACPADAAAPAATACDDGNVCTTDDRCDGLGACRGGGERECAGPCLAGTCDPAVGCVPAPATTSCDDGDVCTSADRCSGIDGTCLAGAPVGCDDGDPCTIDRCDAGVGCLHTRMSGADGLRCAIDRCSRRRLVRRLVRLERRIDRALTAGRTPARRLVARTRTLLTRCGVPSPVGL